MDLGEKLVEELGVKPLFSIGPVIITESIVNTWILLVIVLIACILLTRGFTDANPGKRQLAVEAFVTWVRDLTHSMLGDEAVGYSWFTVTMLFFIGLTNLSALIETAVSDEYTFMKPPTKDLNVTIALALMSIVIVEIAGIHRKGVGGWLKSFTKPIAVITPINILEIIIKPLSLCMRLFGNIFGGFIIMELLKILVPLAIPIPFSCYFEIFDALLQAYVFVFLTSIYISEAVEQEG